MITTASWCCRLLLTLSAILWRGAIRCTIPSTSLLQILLMFSDRYLPWESAVMAILRICLSGALGAFILGACGCLSSLALVPAGGGSGEGDFAAPLFLPSHSDPSLIVGLGMSSRFLTRPCRCCIFVSMDSSRLRHSLLWLVSTSFNSLNPRQIISKTI